MWTSTDYDVRTYGRELVLLRSFTTGWKFLKNGCKFRFFNQKFKKISTNRFEHLAGAAVRALSKTLECTEGVRVHRGGLEYVEWNYSEGALGVDHLSHRQRYENWE